MVSFFDCLQVFRRRPVIATVRRTCMNLISLNFGLIAIVVLTLVIGCNPNALTPDERIRQNITSDLEQMGAYYVGFEEDTSIPDAAFFVNVKSLDGIKRYPTLTHLDFTDSNVSDHDLRELISLPNVFYLELDGTKVSDVGIDTLAAIPNLNVVDLNGTLVSDASVPSLAKIRGLQGVVAESTNLSELGVRELMRLRPEIWVKHESILDPPDEP
ncbi:Leucine Rich repeats (2 copies) [Rubripirellula tenax]|uniref:Leucine Rich repeats (2 copies) n=1 Tax=Rubripirellula tenax TaxID=2528015 RepID=A0A5C6DZR2_9BACT|nr:Leucine Rich repeats (2 copies) [Rubripirellula tenax]